MNKRTSILLISIFAAVAIAVAVVVVLFQPAPISVERSLVQLPDADVWYLVQQRAGLDQIQQAIKASGKEINEFDNMGASLLGVAARQSRMDLARWLLESGADPNGGYPSTVPLRNAIENRDLPMVELLLEYGADPDFDMGNNMTPRRFAKHKGFEEITELLDHLDRERQEEP